VSGFIYKTDATFNTNSLKLPLSVMVGIDNTRATFPIAYCYITSESAASFKWIAEQLTKLAFWDCPKPTLIVGDFSKGLRAAVVAKAAADLAAKVAANLAAKAVDGISVELRDEAKEPDLDLDFLEAAKVVVGEGERQRVQRVKL
jgi:hypothetical protein